MGAYENALIEEGSRQDLIDALLKAREATVEQSQIYHDSQWRQLNETQSALSEARAKIVILQSTCDWWMDVAAKHGWPEITMAGTVYGA